MSIKALSDFLTLSFYVLVPYIFKLTIMMLIKWNQTQSHRQIQSINSR